MLIVGAFILLMLVNIPALMAYNTKHSYRFSIHVLNTMWVIAAIASFLEVLDIHILYFIVAWIAMIAWVESESE